MAGSDYNRDGYTPLMRAVVDPAASVETVRLLLEQGADARQEAESEHGEQLNVMALALSAGDPRKVGLLLRYGADFHYRRAQGYGPIIDAVSGRDVLRDERLLDLLALLIKHGADLNAVTDYGESACRMLSRGRFDAVKLLLDAGADAGPLRWTPLLRAVALGTLDDVRAELDRGESPETRDFWERTAWLLAIQTGDVGKARLLRERGADTNARGRCAKPPLFYAIENHHAAMLRWLLDSGVSLEATDQFGGTPLMCAAENGNGAAVDALLGAGADVNAQKDGQTALGHADTREVARRLLEAGADPQHLSAEGRRALLGFAPRPDAALLAHVSRAGFEAGKNRRFGISNPEIVAVPFWEAIIRAGVSGYEAARRFEDDVKFRRPPVWCAQRFGQSLTFLPDGRIIQVAGEHEDHYDPDFCIYNDVFVHHPDGRIDICAYPEAEFPPTDFHTATLLGTGIYLIGSLGYAGKRRYGTTPVYRLDTHSLRVEKVETAGEMPGWIYGHAATMISADEIRVTGGKVVTWNGQDETLGDNRRAFVFNVPRGTWTAAAPTA